MIALLRCCYVLAVLFCLQFQPTYGVDWNNVYDVCLWDCSLDHAACRQFANWDFNAHYNGCKDAYLVDNAPHCSVISNAGIRAECYFCFSNASSELNRARNACDTARDACDAHCAVTCEIVRGTGDFPTVNF